jgi:hypothetical protein
MLTEEIWMTVSEATEYAKVSRKWIYLRRADQSIKTKREGYRELRLIEKESLDACLQAHSRWLSGYRANQESALAGNSITKKRLTII